MLRGRSHLCDFMPRSKDARRLDADPANEPDFYSITEIFPLDNPSVVTWSSAVAPPIPTDLEDSKPRGRKPQKKQLSNEPPEQQRQQQQQRQPPPPPQEQKQAPEDAKPASAPQSISLPVAPPAVKPVSAEASRPPNLAQGQSSSSFAAKSLSAGAALASTPQQASFVNMPLYLQTHPQPAQAVASAPTPIPGCQPAPPAQPTLANQASPASSQALLLSLVTALQNPQQSALNVVGNPTACQAPNRSVAPPPPPPPPNPPANAAPNATVLQALLAVLPSLTASQPTPQVNIASSIANLLTAAATEGAAPPPPPAPLAAAPSSSGGSLDLFGIISALISANSQGNEGLLANVIRLLRNVGQGQDTSTLAAMLALVLIQQNNNNPSGSAPSSS